MLRVTIPKRIMVSSLPTVDTTYHGPGLLRGQLPDCVAAFAGISHDSHTLWEDGGSFVQGNHRFVMDGRVKPKKKKKNSSFWDYSQPDINIPTKYSQCTSTKLDGQIHWSTLFRSFLPKSVPATWTLKNETTDPAANQAAAYRRITSSGLNNLVDGDVFGPMKDYGMIPGSYYYPKLPYFSDGNKDFSYKSYKQVNLTPLIKGRVGYAMSSLADPVFTDDYHLVVSRNWSAEGLYTSGLYSIKESGVSYTIYKKLNLERDENDSETSDYYQEINISIFGCVDPYPTGAGNVSDTYRSMDSFPWHTALMESTVTISSGEKPWDRVDPNKFRSFLNDFLSGSLERVATYVESGYSIVIDNPYAEEDLARAKLHPDFGKRSSYYENIPKGFNTGKSVLQSWDRQSVAARYGHDLRKEEGNTFQGTMDQYEWTDVAILPFIAEAKGIPAIPKDLKNSLSSLRKIGTGSIRTGAKTGAKTASDLYLQYKYAIAPTIGEVDAIAAELYGILGGTQKARKDSIFYNAFKSYDTPIILRSSQKKSTWDTLYTYQIRCTTVLGSPGDSIKDRLINAATRGGFFNFITAKWELTRLSFVLDWVVPVGDFLGQAETQMRYLSYPYKVIMYSYTVRDTFSQPIDFFLPEKEIYTTPCLLDHYSRYFGSPMAAEVEWDLKFPRKITEGSALLVSNKL